MTQLYKSFDGANKKVRTLWERTFKNRDDLDVIDKYVDLKRVSNYSSNPTLYESDWLDYPITPGTNEDQYTLVLGDEDRKITMPESLMDCVTIRFLSAFEDESYTEGENNDKYNKAYADSDFVISNFHYRWNSIKYDNSSEGSRRARRYYLNLTVSSTVIVPLNVYEYDYDYTRHGVFSLEGSVDTDYTTNLTRSILRKFSPSKLKIRAILKTYRTKNEIRRIKT